MAGGWLPTGGASGAYPDATGEAAGLVPVTDGADGWTFVDLDEAVEDAGRWEVVVAGSPPEAVTDEDETDWLYAWAGA